MPQILFFSALIERLLEQKQYSTLAVSHLTLLLTLITLLTLNYGYITIIQQTYNAL